MWSKSVPVKHRAAYISENAWHRADESRQDEKKNLHHFFTVSVDQSYFGRLPTEDLEVNATLPAVSYNPPATWPELLSLSQ